MKETVEAKHMQFQAELQLKEGSEGDKSSPVSILARSGAIEHGLWGKIEHDFSGMRHKPRIVLDYCHNDDEIVGYANRFDAVEGETPGLTIAGALTPYKGRDRASEIVHKARLGVPYEASIDFRGPISLEKVPAGEKAQVNGHSFEGPGIIVRKWMLRAVAVCPHGADGNTGTKVFQNDENEFPVEFVNKEESKMSEQKVTEEAPAVESAPQVLTPAPEAPAVESAVKPEAPAVEGETPSEPAPESPAEVARKYKEAFGDQGLTWLAEGKTFDEAEKAFVESLKSERDNLKNQLQAFKSAGGETTALSQDPVVVPEASEEKPEAPASFTEGEKAILENLRFSRSSTK